MSRHVTAQQPGRFIGNPAPHKVIVLICVDDSENRK